MTKNDVRWVCIWRDGHGENAHEGAEVYRTEAAARRHSRAVANEDDVTLIACAPVPLMRKAPRVDHG